MSHVICGEQKNYTAKIRVEAHVLVALFVKNQTILSDTAEEAHTATLKKRSTKILKILILQFVN